MMANLEIFAYPNYHSCLLYDIILAVFLAFIFAFQL